MRSALRSLVAGVGLSAAVFITSITPPAHACGCLSPPIPAVSDDAFAVNQQAEQIIFEVEPGFVTAHVLIRYAGEPDKFAWIVPVPDVPVLSLSESITFALVDQATAPSIQVAVQSLCPSPEYRCQYHPPPTGCFGSGAGGSGGSAGGFSADGGLGSGGAAGGSGGGVNVIDRQQIGAYDTVTFGAGDAGAAVAWLNAEGFIVNDTMTPFMQGYIDAGMLFVASKLVPGAGVDQIRPLRMKYAASNPMIPLKLTAVAAEPHLTVTSYIFGATATEAFVPVDHPLLGIDASWLTTGGGRPNYPMVLARAADDAGGDGFVMEFAGAVPPRPPGVDGCCGDATDRCGYGNDGFCSCPGDAFDAADCATEEALVSGFELYYALAARHGGVTRLTTRISPEEMSFDPAFEPGAPVVNGPLTLQGNRKSLDACASDVVDGAFYRSVEDVQGCAAVYCGEGECVATHRGVGCACNPGFVARVFNDLDGEPSVTCVPDRHTVDYAAAGITLPNACAELSCGAVGRCRDVGGFPTCECNAGSGAVVVADAPLPTCATILRQSGSRGARDFSDALEDVRVCAPRPDSCGPWGWLVPNEQKARQGVLCPSSVPTAAQLEVPAKPTCEDYYGGGTGGTGGSGPFDPRDPRDPTAGRGGSAASSSSSGGSAASSGAAPGGGGGCGCGVTPSRSALGAFSALALVAMLVGRRRRRR